MKSKLSGQELIKTVSQISKKYPYYTMACLLLAVLLVDYSLVMRFQWNTLRSVNPEITRLSREVQVTKNNMRRMSRFREETRNLKSQIEQMNRKLKSREEIPLVLENISRLANRNGVNIKRIMPDTSLEEPVLKNDEGQYFSIPIMVEAGSSYHAFGLFLNQLETEGIFWDIPEFTIAVNKSDFRVHIIKLTLDTIVFEEAQK